jgi:hypothetical protein
MGQRQEAMGQRHCYHCHCDRSIVCVCVCGRGAWGVGVGVLFDVLIQNVSECQMEVQIKGVTYLFDYFD